VVEKYISGQKGYEMIDTVPMVAIDEEKEKAHKTWYISLYNKLFGGKRLSNNPKLEEKERKVGLQIQKEAKFLVPKAIAGQPRKYQK